MTRKEEIEARLTELGKERYALQRELKAIEDAVLVERFGFGPGDTIIRPNGEKILVTGFDYSWAKGCKIRKNGEPSKNVCAIYDSTKCKKVTPENA